jgi:hypothetical protein
MPIIILVLQGDKSGSIDLGGPDFHISEHSGNLCPVQISQEAIVRSVFSMAFQYLFKSWHKFLLTLFGLILFLN